MDKKDFEWMVKLIDVFTDIRICTALLMVTSIFLICNYCKKIYLNHDWELIIAFICLYTLFILTVKGIIYIFSQVKHTKDINDCKIYRLNIIFNEIDNSKGYYKNFVERLLLILLYKHKLKSFAIHEFLPYIKDVHPHQVQNVINKLCQNSYPYIDDKILQIKNGKYNFYECVWKELKKYEKSGVLNSENTI